MNAPAKRLPKSERREQLLETALAIVREQGTDALTLGYLAERAGVSKPIAYEHFGTRSGLLIALYRRIDERQAATAARDFERTPKRLSDVARLMGESYMSCFRTAGPECHAIFAALNTMYAAVAARAREIATLRAIGFGSLPVLVSVLIEALLLSLAGGLIGAAIAYVLFNNVSLSTLGANFTQVVFAFKVTPALVLYGVIISLVIGLFGGLLPAARAARMPITTALREL